MCERLMTGMPVQLSDGGRARYQGTSSSGTFIVDKAINGQVTFRGVSGVYDEIAFDQVIFNHKTLRYEKVSDMNKWERTEDESRKKAGDFSMKVTTDRPEGHKPIITGMVFDGSHRLNWETFSSISEAEAWCERFLRLRLQRGLDEL